MRIALFTILAILVAIAIVWYGNGFSRFGTPIDPNVSDRTTVVAADVLRRSLSGLSDSLLERVRSHEITDEEFKDRMAAAAQELMQGIDATKIPAPSAWEYGELFITARDWQKAKVSFEKAVKVAKEEGRRVNDNVRLARVYAELNDVPKAIETARSTFNTKDTEAGPILLATLYEITPAAEGKGHDLELATLLEDAIVCEERTIVDTTKAEGRDFIAARPFHVRRAWMKVIDLYEGVGQQAKAEEARKRMHTSLSKERITSKLGGYYVI